MILYVEVTNIGWTLSGAPIGLVCSTDSVSRRNYKKPHLRVDTHTWSETQGGAPISVVQPSDSVGGAKNNRLNLTLDTYKCSVPQWLCS